MDQTLTPTSTESLQENFASLQHQLSNNKGQKTGQEDIRDRSEETEAYRESPSAKKFVFRKGDQSLEVDEDYEIEFMADKRPTRLTLRELKERAAGDIAIKNRMHSLAEEKKRVQSTFKEFAQIARKDPLGALEYISNKAKESDSEFEYSQYVQKLADQAEKLGQMDEKERKNWELEKKLEKAEQDLSHKERQQAIVQRKDEMLADYPEIGDQQFSQMVDAVLSSEELLDGLEDEHDVMNKVEELIQETLTQRDIISVINDINPAYSRDNSLIFTLSDQLRQNPDLDEEDVRDIVSQLIGHSDQVQGRPQLTERERDARTLSNKARQGTAVRSLRTQNASNFDLLHDQLLKQREKNRTTPLYKR